MNPNTQQTVMTEYGNSATYINAPSNQATGHVPLDTLPAAWWNWLWNQITKNNNEVYATLTDVRTELLNVLSAASISPSGTSTNQLYQAINKIRQTIATTSTAGAVKSSSDIKSVSVANTGVMLVNALTDWLGADTIKSVIDNLTTEVESGDIQAFTITHAANNTFDFTITRTNGDTITRTLQPVHLVSMVSSGNTMKTTVNGVASNNANIINSFGKSANGPILTLDVNGQQVTIPVAISINSTGQILYVTVGGAQASLNTNGVHVGYLGPSNAVYADVNGLLHCKGIQFDI